MVKGSDRISESMGLSVVTCKINHTLPIEPVIAEDGHLYEKHSILNHIKKSLNKKLQSPVTFEPMGTHLYESPTIYKLIETLVETGKISGALAMDWKARTKAQRWRKKEDLLRRASSGELDATLIVAHCYRKGIDGFTKDCPAALSSPYR